MRRVAFALVALLLSSTAMAQTRQPAQITTMPTISPQEYDLLDKTGAWVLFGYVDPIDHSFSLRLTQGVIGTFAGGFANYFLVNDTQQMPTDNTLGIAFGAVQNLNAGFDGTSTTSRGAGYFETNVKAAPATGTPLGGGPQYSALNAQTMAFVPSQGTGLTATTSGGQVGGADFIGQLAAGATHYKILQGAEVDVSAQAGSSTFGKEGLEIVQFATDAVQGASVDCGLCMANQPGAIGWKTALQFGNQFGAQPTVASGTLIGCQGPLATPANCGTAAIGIDLRGYTFTTAALMIPGLTVEQAGTLIIAPQTISAILAQPCNLAGKGAVAFVSDNVAAAAPIWHGALVGGGSTTVNSMVSCNSSNWQYE